jgi:hypothetical protein
MQRSTRQRCRYRFQRRDCSNGSGAGTARYSRQGSTRENRGRAQAMLYIAYLRQGASMNSVGRDAKAFPYGLQGLRDMINFQLFHLCRFLLFLQKDEETLRSWLDTGIAPAYLNLERGVPEHVPIIEVEESQRHIQICGNNCDSARSSASSRSRPAVPLKSSIRNEA